MNKVLKLILANVVLFAICWPMSGQERMFVSSDGQIISLPFHAAVLRSVCFLPKTKPNIKKLKLSIYVREYDEFNDTYGDPKYWGNITFYYDLSGQLIKTIDESPGHNDMRYNGTHTVTYQYDNNQISKVEETYYYSAHNKRYRFIYENGILKYCKSVYENYVFFNDNNNIIKAEEYHSTYYNGTELFQYSHNRRMISYKLMTKNNSIQEEKNWLYDNNNRLISYKTLTKWVYKYEYKYFYGNDSNPTYCILYECGDINKIAEKYEYEYSYTFYPTEEELKRQAEEKRIADSIWQVEQEELRKQQEVEQHRIDSLKNKYQSCRFLFDSRSYYVYCVTKKDQFATEMEIIQLVKKYIQNISDKATTGKELRNINTLGDDMINICNICRNLDDEEIVDHIERELEKFVSARKVLLKAYNKSSYTKYSEFLIDYINKTI